LFSLSELLLFVSLVQMYIFLERKKKPLTAAASMTNDWINIIATMSGGKRQGSRSAVLHGVSLALAGRCLLGVAAFLCLARKRCLMLFEPSVTGGSHGHEGGGLFGHGKGREEQRGQDKRAGNTHGVGHSVIAFLQCKFDSVQLS
jgi:hypothetical protein